MAAGLVLIAATCAAFFGLEPAIAVVAISAGAVVVLASVRGLSVAGRSLSTHEVHPGVTPSGEPAQLGWLVIVALAIRLLVGAVLYFSHGDLSVAPDSVAYVIVGCHVAKSWESPGIDLLMVPGYKDTFYVQLNALVCSYLGDLSGLFLGWLNAALGVAAAWVLSRMTHDLYGPRAARYAFILNAFFPSIVLWTSLNLREGWSFLALSLAVYGAQRLRGGLSLSALLMLALGLTLLPMIRGYLLALVVIGLTASHAVVRVKQLPAALIGMAALLVAVRLATDKLGVLSLDSSLADRLRVAADLREALAYGGSAVSVSSDTGTPLGAVLYLPKGLATFLLAPFPWSVDSWRQAVAVPESVAWYYLLALGVKEMWQGLLKMPSRVAAPILVAAAITFAYALVEGNAGTAYRHRAHVLLLSFVFSAAALGRRSVLKLGGGVSEHPDGGSRGKPATTILKW
ncbi:MAG: hypothetical protein IT384_20075 [Deltaproteobacteria bacterium]|nr:hypothetical protein [Deltaproteobacteria bacterium]